MRPTLRRRELLAYLIGAGVAGTGLAFPYLGRSLAAAVVPQAAMVTVPFFLLPIAWGVWNLIYVRFAPPLGAAPWGAMLGLLASLFLNAFLWVRGEWFGAAALLPFYIPVVYGLAWLFIVQPLTDALVTRG